jgi:hypothetical protein
MVRKNVVLRSFTLVGILCATLAGYVIQSPAAVSPPNGRTRAQSDQAVNPVVQWNQILLRIVRTPGAQQASIHPTRSFAIIHAAIYDAVNSIDGTHRPYLMRVSGAPQDASQEAAAAVAAHEVLIQFYPAFQPMLDTELQTSLDQVPTGAPKTSGMETGQMAADKILGARSNDGSAATPLPFAAGTNPGDYQPTLPTNTAADPSYPGAHAAISNAGAAVLDSFLRGDHFKLQVTSEVMPGVVRSFTTFSAAADETTLSRVYAGQHFIFDETAGARLGRKVARFVLNNFLTPAAT